jgi:hypothetical protein
MNGNWARIRTEEILNYFKVPFCNMLGVKELKTSMKMACSAIEIRYRYL